MEFCLSLVAPSVFLVSLPSLHPYGIAESYGLRDGISGYIDNSYMPPAMLAFFVGVFMRMLTLAHTHLLQGLLAITLIGFIGFLTSSVTAVRFRHMLFVKIFSTAALAFSVCSVSRRTHQLCSCLAFVAFLWIPQLTKTLALPKQNLCWFLETVGILQFLVSLH